MMTSRKSKTVQRLGRPKTDTLSRERVLEEALVLLDRAGVEAITMRRIAEHLGVTPMAIYNHVSGKKDLLEGIAQRLVSEIDFFSSSSDWRERIRTCFYRLRRACLAHPHAVRLLESLHVAPPAVFSPMEITLAALDQVGMTATDAVRAYYLLMNFTLGQVSYEVRGPFQALEPAVWLRRHGLQDAQFPHVKRAVAFKKWDFDAAFEFGLSAIMAGVEQVGRKRKSPNTT